MIYLARCPICKTEQYGYNWVSTPKGKKWLKNIEGKWHDCPKSTGKYQSKKQKDFVKVTYKFFDFCELCSHLLFKESIKLQYPQFSGETLTEHLKIFHPNNEILDEIDFMVISDEDKEKLRLNWGMPKSNKKYISKNKIVSKVD